MVASKSTDHFYNWYHKECRGPDGCVGAYKVLCSPDKGVQHIVELFSEWSDMKTLEFLGYVLDEQDLPMVCNNILAKRYIDDEKTNLKEDFVLQVAMAGHLLRRALWHLEGIPGVLVGCNYKIHGRYNISQHINQQLL
jgi:hypothetical protein